MSKELDALIARVERVHEFDEFGKVEISKSYIKKHYGDIALGFKYFHSFDGCVHMGVSDNDTFHKNDFYAQIKRVATQIKKQRQESVSEFKVLELGCGKGFNISHLAKEFRDIHFVGIDITPKHLAKAKQKVKALRNVEIRNMDFDQLDFKPNEFDLIYTIESICYSFAPEKLSNDVYTLLKNNGCFLVFDLFRNAAKKPTTVQEEKLLKYIEASASLKKVITNESWSEIVRNTGFQELKNDTLSEQILPTLNRFNKLAKTYYYMPFLSRCINTLIPKPLAKSSVASYLLKYSVENSFHLYSEIILQKYTVRTP